MKVEKIYTGCLAKAAYYIESEREAVIIDPFKESQPYIEKAKVDNAKIKYVLETQFNRNFISGHLDLAKKTGAIIVYGPTTKPGFEAHIAKDNEELKVGNITIKVLHTPGHTLESTTYLLKDENGKDYAVFPGNALFLRNVGQAALAFEQKEITLEDLAGALFDSLQNKIMPLADDVIVYPGQRAVSACGKKMSKKTEGSLGDLKMINYAFKPGITKKEFVKKITSTSIKPRRYFSKKEKLDKVVYEQIDYVGERDVMPLSIKAFKAAWELEEALVLDTRNKDEFTKGFIPGSIFIGIEGGFNSCVSELITDLNRPIIFIADTGREDEVVTGLSKLGYKNSIGYLKGGFEKWKKAGEQVDVIQQVIPIVFAELYKRKNINVLDVRIERKFNSEHIIGVVKFPLDSINRNMNLVNRNERHYLQCENGYRSLVATSILKARGIHDVINVKEGYKELSKQYLKRSKYKEQVIGF